MVFSFNSRKLDLDFTVIIGGWILKMEILKIGRLFIKKIYKKIKFSVPKKANNMGTSLLSLGEINMFNKIAFIFRLAETGKILNCQNDTISSS